MTCYHPMKGYRSRVLGPNGKRSIVFQASRGFPDLPVTVPCGQCIGCRLERSRQWAIRCLHEASLYQQNSFITLTYSDEHLPADGSLNKSHFQKFMKRLRRKHGPKIRFYHCGEYGEKLRRPHYHACLFNFDFNDKVLYQNSRENPLYTSDDLAELWPMGYHMIGDVTFESAAYVARYIMKKINGAPAEKHYQEQHDYVDPTTGEIHEVELPLSPEYTTMSRMPGLGLGWLKKYGATDVQPYDEVIIRGKIMRPPQYYDRQYELTDPKLHARMKGLRKRKAKKHQRDQTPDRLRVREYCQQKRLDDLPRNFEKGTS